jgi:hypothetical protein
MQHPNGKQVARLSLSVSKVSATLGKHGMGRGPRGNVSTIVRCFLYLYARTRALSALETLLRFVNEPIRA